VLAEVQHKKPAHVLIHWTITARSLAEPQCQFGRLSHHQSRLSGPLRIDNHEQSIVHLHGRCLTMKRCPDTSRCCRPRVNSASSHVVLRSFGDPHDFQEMIARWRFNDVPVRSRNFLENRKTISKINGKSETCIFAGDCIALLDVNLMINFRLSGDKGSPPFTKSDL
jgi:hypothetical protein